MKINVLDHSTVSIMIFRMMVDLDESRGRKFDLRELFSMDDSSEEVDVKLTVNGIEVDCVKCLLSCWDQLDNAYEKKAEELAKEIISLAGLSELQEKIDTAKWEIDDAISQAIAKIKVNNA